MKEWWNRKKRKTRKSKKGNENYTFFDAVIDIFYWIPELIILPFRIVFWFIRGFIKHIFDFN